MHPDLRSSKHQAVRASVCLFVALCSLLALAGCASEPSQGALPAGSPVPGALQTATPLASTPEPSIPAPPPTSTPRPTSTPPTWPLLEGEDVLPAPLFVMSKKQVSRIERDGRTSALQLPPAAVDYDVSPADGTLVVATQGRLWLDGHDSTYPTLLLVGLPNPEATDDCYDLRDPVWSPDGRYIAYADGGIRVWDMALAKRIDVAEIPVQTEEYLVPWTFYGTCYDEPRWSPRGDAILFFMQPSDSRTLMLVTLQDKEVQEIPGTWRVEHKDVAWSADGKALLFDCRPKCFEVIQANERSYVRLTLSDLQARALWPQDNVAYPFFPFQASDGRILYFQEDECNAGSCNTYSLMEGTLTPDRFDVHLLRKNVLPDAVYNVTWHESGNYVAFAIGPDDNPTVAVLRVDTGEIFAVLRENTTPSKIRWGKQ